MRNRIAALIMALCLLLSVGASAEGIDCLRENDGLAVSSYPNVTLAASSPNMMVSYPEDHPMVFLQFPLPDGFYAAQFDNSDCVIVSDKGDVVIQYELLGRYSFESFLDGQPEDTIVADGSDGLALFVETDKSRAEALVDMKDFGSMAKLFVYYRTDERNPDIESLSAGILAELDRIKASMQIIEPGDYWSKGVYNSIELTVSRAPVSVVVDARELNITGVKYSYSDDIDAYTPYGDHILEYGIELSTSSHVEYQREKDESAVYTYTAASGNAYGVYLYQMDNGKVSSFYFDLPLYKYEDRDDIVYLSTSVSGVIDTRDEVEKVIEALDAMYAINGRNL